MALSFSWDSRKAAGNERKHGVSFEEAVTAFGDLLSITVPDPDHSADENRFLLLGLSDNDRLLVVAHVERGDDTRIINPRLATRRERTKYEEGD
jgi:uncharacterized DUF497 family protein